MSNELSDADVRRRHFYFIGLGSVAQTVLPLAIDYLSITSDQITIFSPEVVPDFAGGRFGTHEMIAITQDNYATLLGARIKNGDFVLNLATEVSSEALITLCQSLGAIYLDTVIEPWPGWYDNPQLTNIERSNYALRERIIAQKKSGSPTAVITHGANPGLVSHFVKAAIEDVAQKFNKSLRHDNNSWAALAHALDLRTIHISEYDSQQCGSERAPHQFFNTWSVMGFVAEASQPAELGWGTHEKQLPTDASIHTTGCAASICLNRPGATVKVKSWAPKVGPYHGFLITHGESISLADHLTLRDQERKVIYRPTVLYAYRPCDTAIASLHDLVGRQWQLDSSQSKVVQSEITRGDDLLGVLLGFGSNQCYWLGSRMSIEQARTLCPNANATSLQVAAGVLGAMVWAIENPDRGIVEPEDMDWRRVLEVATPLLGEILREFSAWHPLVSDNGLFPHPLTCTDPWSFTNVRVNYS